MSTFEELGALPEIARALRDVGIVEAFPIQEMTLPIALMGTDLIGQARTGTGKTLAFSIPLLQRVISPHDPDYDELAAPGHPQALVVAPTRELALQVAGDLAVAGAHRGARFVSVYGGVPYEPQLAALEQGVDIVVGTPGRLLDLSNRRVLDLSHVKVLVLDEADEMLDLGFLPDVEKLIAKTPQFRQTMLFSATMRGAVIALARTHMRHPVNVRAEAGSDGLMVPATAQFVYQTHDLDKPECLARILQAENRGLTLVFTRTKRQAQRVADDLEERGFPAAPLHGDMPQVAREKALKRFRAGAVQILVATDVAARGIDVEAVTHVINYSCPEDDKMYVHRVGRTGRAGASGTAVTFVDWPDRTRWAVINKALGLPYDNPPETYSTSPNLYSDLGIPTDAKSRLVPAPEAPARRPAREETGGSGRGGRGGQGARPDRGRPRQRRRRGEVLDQAGSRGDSAGERRASPNGGSGDAGTASNGSNGSNGSTGSSTAVEAQSPSPRRRRRRARTRSGAPVEQDQT